MALKKCKECGKEVSTKADKCPHCGAPAKGLLTKKLPGCLRPTTGAVLGVIFIVVMIAYWAGGPEEKKERISPPSKEVSTKRAPKTKTPAKPRPPERLAKAPEGQISDIPKPKLTVPIPTPREIELHKALWKALDAQPGVDEDIIMRRVARKYRLTVKQLNNINIKVEAYKMSKEKVNQEALEAIVKAVVRNRLEEAKFFAPNGAANVVYRDETGWKAHIQQEWMYLINAVMENLPDVEMLQVMVKGKTMDGDWVKAATIDVKRNQFTKAIKMRLEVDRFRPWYHPNL